MSSWHSYPKVWNIGHPQVASIFDDPVVVEEKVDGSQISFGVFDGELKVRSKGKEQYPQTDKMFLPAIKEIEQLAPRLINHYTYSGEYLSKPKHNTLAYKRTPERLIILFDIRIAEETYIDRRSKASEAQRLGLEVVPCLFDGKVENAENVFRLMKTESILGGQTIEGLVFKNYSQYGRDGKVLMAKHVSEIFKERNKADFRSRNPSQGDLIQQLCVAYRSEARWKKAVQHLREQGALLGEPRDIGPLMKEVQQDLLEEAKEEIADRLFKHAWKHIARRSVAGLAEWYKNQLVAGAFDN